MAAATRRQIEVSGVVQGVGFRPFVYSLANDLNLVGFVRNEITHVHIEVQGSSTHIETFLRHLQTKPPPMSRIDSIDHRGIPTDSDSGFVIAVSTNGASGASAALIPPDTSVCADCVDELLDPTDRRYRYPFTTCTNCGPRFTIITSLPYDRPNTTMCDFPLCDECSAEYSDPSNRRHHAQPIACHKCGPKLWREVDGIVTSTGDGALADVLEDLNAGLIVAIKGVGGYHLAVDATNAEAVNRLRKRKARLDKPFAIMVADLSSALRLARIDDHERSALTSAARPIVLLRKDDDSGLPNELTQGNPLIGVLLPYTPLHHLLFQPVPGRATPAPSVLVMTSGNVSSEPICIDDSEARERLADIADSFCVNDRPIHTPCDDSVVRLVDGAEFPIRRGRGFAPLPVRLPVAVAPTLAVGGEIKNTFALATGNSAWISQHLGDMENLETAQAFESAVDLFTDVYRTQPDILAVDSHPDYRTRRWAHDHADGHEVIEVQHHHAHLAALMAEHGLDGTQPVIGFVFDGTGYGPDGALWGGEVLIGDYSHFERWGHLAEVRIPGGDSAVHNPCRTALAHLKAAGVDWADELPPVRACDPTELQVLEAQLSGGTACVTSTSMGRLFDVVASLLGLRHRITYEAQAAIELEVLASEASGVDQGLHFDIDEHGRIDSAPLVRDIVAGLRAGVDRKDIASGFHNAVVEAIVASANSIRESRSLNVVCLTGGVFQNVLLTSLATHRLEQSGFEVLRHHIVPPNDGGIALGQVMVAAHHDQTDQGSCQHDEVARTFDRSEEPCV